MNIKDFKTFCDQHHLVRSHQISESDTEIDYLYRGEYEDVRVVYNKVKEIYHVV